MDRFEYAGHVIEEYKQGYIMKQNTDDLPPIILTPLNVDGHACEMLDKDSYIVCSKSKFIGLVDNDDALNIEKYLLIPWDNDQTEHMHEDTMTLLSDGMQDSGDCFIQHDQSEHVHEDSTILILDGSKQDSSDSFIPHNQTEMCKSYTVPWWHHAILQRLLYRCIYDEWYKLIVTAFIKPATFLITHPLILIKTF